MAAKRDYPHREPKKPKKGAGKAKGVSSILSTPVAAEVIKKERKRRKTEVEEEEE